MPIYVKARSLVEWKRLFISLQWVIIRTDKNCALWPLEYIPEDDIIQRSLPSLWLSESAPLQMCCDQCITHSHQKMRVPTITSYPIRRKVLWTRLNMNEKRTFCLLLYECDVYTGGTSSCLLIRRMCGLEYINACKLCMDVVLVYPHSLNNSCWTCKVVLLWHWSFDTLYPNQFSSWHFVTRTSDRL